MSEIPMREHFGAFLGDGDLGNKFRFCEIELLVNKTDQIVFDFEGVTNMTDSFANACFGNLAEDHAFEMASKFRFKNCSPLIRQSLSAALNAGIQRGKQYA
ncbi:MAG: STAS-like domain-containing protein [Chthoniobacterales bacterium]